MFPSVCWIKSFSGFHVFQTYIWLQPYIFIVASSLLIVWYLISISVTGCYQGNGPVYRVNNHPLRETCFDCWAVSPSVLILAHCTFGTNPSLIARFMGPTWDPSGADRTQVGPILAPWTLLSGIIFAIAKLHHNKHIQEYSIEIILSKLWAQSGPTISCSSIMLHFIKGQTLLISLCHNITRLYHQRCCFYLALMRDGITRWLIMILIWHCWTNDNVRMVARQQTHCLCFWSSQLVWEANSQCLLQLPEGIWWWNRLFHSLLRFPDDRQLFVSHRGCTMGQSIAFRRMVGILFGNVIPRCIKTYPGSNAIFRITNHVIYNSNHWLFGGHVS